MNTTTNATSDRLDNNARNRAATPITHARREHRVRDFGIGYGSSSGYGLSKRYTSDWAQPRFRCA